MLGLYYRVAWRETRGQEGLRYYYRDRQTEAKTWGGEGGTWKKTDIREMWKEDFVGFSSSGNTSIYLSYHLHIPGTVLVDRDNGVHTTKNLPSKSSQCGRKIDNKQTNK